MPHHNSQQEIEELREKLARALVSVGLLEQINATLLEKLRLLRIKKFGPSGDKLSPEQANLLEQEPSVTAAEVEAEAALGEKAKDLKPKLPRKKPVRGPLPTHLPRVSIIIACAETQCGQCGGAKKLIGYETSERLSCKPLEFFVEETKREKCACARCEEMGVSVAPVPASIIEKGILSDSLVLDSIIKKYCEHKPFYRYSASVESDTGIFISQSTLSACAMKVGQLLQIVCGPMKEALLAGDYIQADETTVPVQTKLKKGKNHQAYFWQYSRPGGPVVFDFRMGREREGPAAFLAGFNGKLQCDGYSAYEKIGGALIEFFGCMAHARRKFVDAAKLDPKDVTSAAIVAKMGDLYDVEREALGLDANGRGALRAVKSIPLLAELKAMVISASTTALPQSVFGKACAYTLNQWERLERYAAPGNGAVEIDNNWAENGMRGIALGRKNWIHIGSEEAGPKIAAILSILETCKRLKIKAREYLADVLPQLSYWSTRPGTGPQSYAALTPMAWKAARDQAQPTAAP